MDYWIQFRFAHTMKTNAISTSERIVSFLSLQYVSVKTRFFFSDFKQIYDPALGNCFTYNFDVNHLKQSFRAGAPYGLTILLQGSQSDYMCTSQTAGFKVIIHNATEHPFPDTSGYLIAPGTSSNLAIKQVCNVL